MHIEIQRKSTAFPYHFVCCQRRYTNQAAAAQHLATHHGETDALATVRALLHTFRASSPAVGRPLTYSRAKRHA